MASSSCLVPINIEDEETILTINVFLSILMNMLLLILLTIINFQLLVLMCVSGIKVSLII